MGTSAQLAAEVVQTTNGGSIRAGVWSGVIIAAIGLFSLVVKQWGPWKVIAGQQQEAAVSRMEERIKTLEGRIDTQAAAYQATLTAERAQHAAEISSMRHRMNNLDQCLTMLLMLIEQDPEKARDAAARVRLMREKQEATEKAERATINAARIVASGVPIPETME